VDSICIEKPAVQLPGASIQGKGEPVVGGGVMFRGRAAQKLTDGLPRRPLSGMTSCPYEELENPSRVHVDPFGHVHVCQGITMGNVWQSGLSEILRDYQPHRHPIIGPLIRGGPARLAAELGLSAQDGFVDECHGCFVMRQQLLDRFPDFLAPRQVYGQG
jgi:hypothetical protein